MRSTKLNVEIESVVKLLISKEWGCNRSTTQHKRTIQKEPFWERIQLMFLLMISPARFIRLIKGETFAIWTEIVFIKLAIDDVIIALKMDLCKWFGSTIHSFLFWYYCVSMLQYCRTLIHIRTHVIPLGSSMGCQIAENV